MANLSRRGSRRQFLGTVGRGAAALTVPAIVRSGAIAAVESTAANDRVGVGHIGIGSMGRGHLRRHYAGNKTQMSIAVCDVDAKNRARGVSRVGPHCDQYADYREILDRKDIDAVVVAVPDHWHALIAIHACEAGKDVYCEKPLSLTVVQAHKMVEAARRYGRVFQTGSQQRSSEEFQAACALVQQGYLGHVHTVNVNVSGTSHPCHLPAEKVPVGLDWETWIGPAPWKPFSSRLHPWHWRSFREFSGGNMTDWGAHHLDVAQWGLGRSYSGPVEVHPPAAGENFLRFVYDDGVVVRCGALGGRGIEFIGTRGSLKVDRGFFEITPADLAPGPHPDGRGRLQRHHENWWQALETRGRPAADVEIAARSVTVCHLGNIALWLGRSIQWDPTNEKIVGDEAASRWLDRPLRAPYHI